MILHAMLTAARCSSRARGGNLLVWRNAKSHARAWQGAKASPTSKADGAATSAHRAATPRDITRLSLTDWAQAQETTPVRSRSPAVMCPNMEYGCIQLPCEKLSAISLMHQHKRTHSRGCLRLCCAFTNSSEICCTYTFCRLNRLLYTVYYIQLDIQYII